ncbi:hypothetical protein CFAM422_002810 [Trichoderma lentiforme]|uniref:Uncharacterized protein n=1 Tax=Trichoderma lentiforme TaxID=1567552 RepID=A0A9P4XLP4_9HYPO|nr:hypothetical protein CFAM422_002810 [Trichoderma lentiforme]
MQFYLTANANLQKRIFDNWPYSELDLLHRLQNKWIPRLTCLDLVGLSTRTPGITNVEPEDLDLEHWIRQHFRTIGAGTPLCTLVVDL